LPVTIVPTAAAGRQISADLAYTDPTGLFSVPIPTNWTAEEEQKGSYVRLKRS